MSCCLPLQPEQIPKKLSIITVSLPRECRKSPPSCFSTQNMPFLPVTSSFNLIPYLPLLGAWLGLQAICFPAFGLGPGSCDTPPTSFLRLALLLCSKGLQLSPRWVITMSINMPVGKYVFHLLNCHLPVLCADCTTTGQTL